MVQDIKSKHLVLGKTAIFTHSTGFFTQSLTVSFFILNWLKSPLPPGKSQGKALGNSPLLVSCSLTGVGSVWGKLMVASPILFLLPCWVAFCSDWVTAESFSFGKWGAAPGSTPKAVSSSSSSCWLSRASAAWDTAGPRSWREGWKSALSASSSVSQGGRFCSWPSLSPVQSRLLSLMTMSWCSMLRFLNRCRDSKTTFVWCRRWSFQLLLLLFDIASPLGWFWHCMVVLEALHKLLRCFVQNSKHDPQIQFDRSEGGARERNKRSAEWAIFHLLSDRKAPVAHQTVDFVCWGSLHTRQARNPDVLLQFVYWVCRQHSCHWKQPGSGYSFRFRFSITRT